MEQQMNGGCRMEQYKYGGCGNATANELLLLWDRTADEWEMWYRTANE